LGNSFESEITFFGRPRFNQFPFAGLCFGLGPIRARNEGLFSTRFYGEGTKGKNYSQFPEKKKRGSVTFPMVHFLGFSLGFRAEGWFWQKRFQRTLYTEKKGILVF